MYEGTGSNSNSILKVIKSEIDKCRTKIDETNRSVKETEMYRKGLDEARNNQQILQHTILYAKGKKKQLVEYNAKKKEKSLAGIHSAIYSAKTIIPDTVPVTMHITREEASLVNSKGDDINLVEGSAFRATLSLFTRLVVLNNTDYLKYVILDEPLTTLSPDSSALFSKYLPILSKNMLIVLIEQKDEVFLDTEGIVYDFHKSENATQVRRYIP